MNAGVGRRQSEIRLKPITSWLLGVLIVAPLVSLVLAYVAAYEFTPTALVVYLLGYLGWGTLALALVAFSIHLLKYNQIAWPGKVLWVAVLILMNVIAFPLYWLTFVHAAKKAVPH